MIKPLSRTMTLAVGVLTSQLAFSATQYHRVVWDSDPAHEAVIGFSPKGYSSQPYVKFGNTTDEATWTSRQPDYNRIFNGSLRSYFVRLDGLTPDSNVYYRVCDQGGCGERLWFKTAPADDSGFVAIAGGDTRATRSGETYRREGNQLISKVRPLFIMHGGDYTAFNSANEMKRYLQDWRLTFSNDVIDGKAYKRIYPFIPTHGNHEDYDFSTVCKVFGVDSDKNGVCNPLDTFGAVGVSPLMRVYTLNTQFAKSGWGSYARSMNRWFAEDLAVYGDQSVWRVAQYHRPLFPHLAMKGESPTQYGWWAKLFYEHNMNLIVESDSHLTKATREVKPEGKGYVLAPEGGNVFVGEGSWGAPARSANDPKNWTLDAGAVQQVKVIQVTRDKMTVRTAQFDDTASTLSREEREADALRLPENVNWWSLNEVGEKMELVKAASGLTVLLNQEPVVEPSFVEISAEEDVFVSYKQRRRNFEGHREGLLVDSHDREYGPLMSLMAFDTQGIPECADIEGIKLNLQVTNPSKGQMKVQLANRAWRANSATWQSVRGKSIGGKTLATFVPSSAGMVEIDLTGSNLLSLWESDGNNGLVITPTTSVDGLDFQSIETGKAPTLVVNYKKKDECSPIASKTVTLKTSDDTFITQKQRDKNFNNHKQGVLIDRQDNSFGKMQGLIKFDLSTLPANAQIESVVLELNITNVSHGNFKIKQARKDWSEDSITWNSFWRTVGGGDHLTTFTATRSLGVQKIDLTDTEIVGKWLRGGNTGLFITPDTTNGLGFSTHELGSGPVLKVTYH